MTRCLKQVVYLILHCLHVLRCLHNAVDEKTQMSEVVVCVVGMESSSPWVLIMPWSTTPRQTF